MNSCLTMLNLRTRFSSSFNESLKKNFRCHRGCLCYPSCIRELRHFHADNIPWVKIPAQGALEKSIFEVRQYYSGFSWYRKTVIMKLCVCIKR